MSNSRLLKAILSHLKKRSLLLDVAEAHGEKQSGLLSALLLQVGLGQAFDSGSQDRLKHLYDLTNALCPPPVAFALPYPSEDQFVQALGLLPTAPKVVQGADPCMLGYLYQFFCSNKRRHARQLVQTANKSSGLEEIISFTQLYTPTPVVDFLLSQCLPDEQSLTLQAAPHRKLRLLDPACGAGNFLVRAFDLLLPIQLQSGVAEPEAVSSILAENLFGCDIDRTALWITALSMAVRIQDKQLGVLPVMNLSLLIEAPLNEISDAPVASQACRLQGAAIDQTEDGGGAVLGALKREWESGHMLSQKYDCVVGNPPYLGRKLLDRKVKDYLRRSYLDAHQDLCTAFVKRGLEMLKTNGRLGYITQSSLLYLPTLGKFRRTLIDDYFIVQVVEAGGQVFPLQSGEKVNSILLILENGKQSGRRSRFVDLRAKSESELGECLRRPAEDGAQPTCLCDQLQFLQHRQNAFNYRCPEAIVKLRAQAPRLGRFTEIRQGLATGDNRRFVRYWWQIAPENLADGWVPYVKGGGSQRWYCPIETVIDWTDSGAAVKQSVLNSYPYLKGKTAWVVKNERFYFKPGLTFSLVNTQQLSVREMPEGCIFDVAGSALFPHDSDRNWMLSYLNSSFIAAYAQILNPTINYQVGDLKELPVIPFTEATKQQLSDLGRDCVALKRTLYSYAETDMTARHPALPADLGKAYEQISASMRNALGRLQLYEQEIDDLVISHLPAAFGLSRQELTAIEQLCSEAVARRRPVALPFTTIDEFARLILRFFLYGLKPGISTFIDLERIAGPALAQIEQVIGCTTANYVALQFVQDQHRYLHGTIRRAVETTEHSLRFTTATNGDNSWVSGKP